MSVFAADFETTTRKDDCRVWAWAACDTANEKNLYLGTRIDEFLSFCEESEDNHVFWFHNLKFDSSFLIDFLFKAGYKHVSKAKDRNSKTFKVMMNQKGLIYGMEVVFFLRGKTVNKATFYDSSKLFPGMKVAKIAEAFKMPIRKLSIDYTAHDDLPEGAPLTSEEKQYIINDVKIMASALGFFFSQGLDRITLGSCALADYKKIVGKRAYDRWFPVYRDIQTDLRQSYRGGYTYLNPKFKDRAVGRGVVLDVNSMFPSCMKYDLLPWGTPIYYQGKYETDEIYPLYIQMLRCSFVLKKGKLPTVQVKHSGYYGAQNEYLTTSHDEELTLYLNSVDLELFFENYDVTNVEYFHGWKFKGRTGMFTKYIDKWTGLKTKSKEEKNWGMYLISKLFLNALYGKFGTSVELRSKVPYLDGDGVVRYEDKEPEPQDGGYVAVASFITGHARRRLIHAAQRIQDEYHKGISKREFIYCDTDSLHIKSDDYSLPEWLEIDKKKLGAWKFESKFKRGKFLRQKCYIEESTEDVTNSDPEWQMKITVAGMPEECHSQVTFDNFKIGAKYSGKLMPTAAAGGTVLEEIDFTIKR